ncbi:MAG: ABC transporter ATP-binding protein [Christensenellales bacterium]|jgi:peptide/nickel transport system ATP-binding protein
MNQEDNVILSIQDLSVHYITRDIGTCKAVNNFSLNIHKGETIGLVGETGAGKTTVALSILRLLQSPPGKVISGKILFNGQNIYSLKDEEMRRIRGENISMIFQDPMTALNPIDYVGDQISEMLYLHHDVSRAKAMEMAGEMMEVVGIPKERYKEYPHQFSGGMKQRIVIAMALACSPQLLLADEPTTALDVTIQAQVLDMMNDLKRETGTSLLLITHDLGIVAGMCDRVAIMYGGEIVELGDVRQIYHHTLHPYTRGLFNSLPSKSIGKRLKPIPGLMPDPANLPEGCKFAERCEESCEQCTKDNPQLVEVVSGHWVRCIKA